MFCKKGETSQTKAGTNQNLLPTNQTTLQPAIQYSYTKKKLSGSHIK
ncbi:hypothetical protein [Sporosarcina sp.]|nr:hypothetical protein [Sporosarcina sp.]